MYQYDPIDQRIIDERVAQFSDQTQRYLRGEISEEQFLPLRLQNGLYVQRLAPMLRIAVPYGTLNTRQLRKLAHITRHYDKGYAHISTRQNVQINWPPLEEVPDILRELASVEMHAVQTSGNCIRNVTADQYSGVARDEIVDARPWCEIVRQWSTFHPEFAFLPRKFKIAISGSTSDRAAVAFHDIGLQMQKNSAGEISFQVMVGGGLGRTPVIGSTIHEALPEKHLLTYLEAIMRVYNKHGRRDNKFKARIKILVRATGVEEFRNQVEAEWEYIRDNESTLSADFIASIQAQFAPPAYKTLPDQPLPDTGNADFARWLKHNVLPHKQSGYSIVTASLKETGYPPGDISAEQLEALADIVDEFGFGELRSTHEQNLVLPDCETAELERLWQRLDAIDLASPVIGTLNDIICCPGGDYCALANAKSIPIAEAIQRRFDDLDYLYDLGPVELNISGCMNACGHHHIGHIGILGVDKKGQEFYQVSLGGSQSNDASIASILGPSFAADEIPDVIEKLVAVYVEARDDEETFLQTFRRIGVEPFKARVYA